MLPSSLQLVVDHLDHYVTLPPPSPATNVSIISCSECEFDIRFIFLWVCVPNFSAWVIGGLYPLYAMGWDSIRPLLCWASPKPGAFSSRRGAIWIFCGITLRLMYVGVCFFRHAGTYTAEEVALILRDKLIHLQSLYIDQFRYLHHMLREKRRKYVHGLSQIEEASTGGKSTEHTTWPDSYISIACN